MIVKPLASLLVYVACSTQPLFSYCLSVCVHALRFICGAYILMHFGETVHHTASSVVVGLKSLKSSRVDNFDLIVYYERHAYSKQIRLLRYEQTHP